MTTLSPAERLSSALTAADADLLDAIDALAREFAAEGMKMQEMFTLYSREQTAARAVEDDLRDDAISEVIDRISGWCAKPLRVFATPPR